MEKIIVNEGTNRNGKDKERGKASIELQMKIKEKREKI